MHLAGQITSRNPFHLMTPTISRLALAALALTTSILSAQPALAAVACGSGNFDAWLADFKTDAAAKGISQQAIAAGLAGVTLDQSVLNRDRSQKVFTQTFEEFSGRMVPPRMTRGSNMMKQYGSVLSRIEQTYGVPGEVLVAIWGLETDFGVNTGKFATIRSLATLAYDCRRAEQFRGELMDALRIVQRGDLAPADMKGAWAGELGQTQFMPSSWMKYAVDFDGNGKRDLLHNAPDVLASTANYLAGYGWSAWQGLAAGKPEFRGATAVEQERGLFQDRRLFRHPARARPLRSPDKSVGPIARRPALS
ncbi:membrane-bound lytic murein transglycosylase B [Bradyrhizobium japonicum]